MSAEVPGACEEKPAKNEVRRIAMEGMEAAPTGGIKRYDERYQEG